MLGKVNEIALRAWARLEVLRIPLRNERGGMGVVEALLILGVGTIILMGTYFLAKDPITNWWNKYIMPQFPQ
ncbi:hypothetical protein EDD75_0396 [Thermodesulfitimonas autotrophica]|uniref:Uncharacterized protein n=1 Tax=Thermodesulfitimonas autotrophica TaxID=1894989 RepID=A0A3N5BIS5_9THEO|nr:hypothetical protein [Thermodesulfitimonas autotrophica]RPF49578.1 hypothetical protein EDD75_0396 [Thermodesulfitimonas autotrophica]